MHARVYGALALALFGDRVGLAFADDPTPAATEPKLTSPQPPEPEVRDSRAAGLAIDHFTFDAFGYLRIQYIAVQNDPNVEFVGRDDGFEIQNARFGFAGTYHERARYIIAIDGAVDERTQVNTPQGKLAVGLRDAYVDVALAGKVSTYRPETLAFIRGGYFQTWVDPEALVPDTTREFVDHPIESRGMRATEGYQTPGLPPGRSIGTAIRLEPQVGDQAGFGFEIAAQNGADEFSSNNDNDALALSIAGLARFARDSWIVVAGRWNPRTVGMLPFRQDESDYQGSAGIHAVIGPASFGAGGIVQHTTYETTGGPSQNAYGAHVQAMFTVGPPAQPFSFGYRFGILDPSSLFTTDRVMEHTVGAVLGVPRLRMRFQLQLVHVVEQAARDLRNDRGQIAAELDL